MRISFIISLFLTKKLINIYYIVLGDYMKHFKSKKRIRFKFLLTIMTIYIINKNFNIKFTKSNKTIIDYIFNNDITYSYDNKIKKIYNKVNSNIFNNPINLLHSNIEYTTPAYKLLYVKNNPKVYIYNSHEWEMYMYNDLESSLVPNVMLASSMLKEKLESIGIKTIVEKNSILEYMNYNNMDSSESYKASRHFLDMVYLEYPNLDLYIDLHRDALTHDISTVYIEDKAYAKILFVIGLENSNYEVNLNVVNKLNNILLRDYPNITRGIMKKEGYGVNGVYNQDLNGNVILIEVGGNENNIDEVYNTLDVLAKVIGEYINEKEKV